MNLHQICCYISKPLNCVIAGNKIPNYTENFPHPNECKIIVFNKQQRAYAEYVNHTKGFGVLVDIPFLKDEALFTRKLDNVAYQGILHVIIISLKNETPVSESISYKVHLKSIIIYLLKMI